MPYLKLDPDDENPSSKIAAFLLDTTWKIADEFGVCPICLVALMTDMVEDAFQAGRIHHMQSEEEKNMGEPPTETRQ